MFTTKLSPQDFLKEWLSGKYLSDKSQERLEKYYWNFLNSSEYQFRHYGNRLTEITKHIQQSKNTLEILDYGSGSGTESLYFSLLGASVFGIDYYEEDLLELAKERKNILEQQINKKLKIDFTIKSLDDMKNHTKQYDIIWLNEAFHHIEPREDFLQLIPKLLKKGGKIFISEPNAYNFINQLYFFKHRGFKTIDKMKGKDGEDIIFGNERIIFPLKLRKILKKQGIECVFEKYFRISPLNNASKITLFLEKILTKTNFMNIHYLYIGEKK